MYSALAHAHPNDLIGMFSADHLSCSRLCRFASVLIIFGLVVMPNAPEKNHLLCCAAICHLV